MSAAVRRTASRGRAFNGSAQLPPFPPSEGE
jgi:hypothetical protein